MIGPDTTRESLRDLFTLLAIGFQQPTEQLAQGLADGSFSADLTACLDELGQRPQEIESRLASYAGQDVEPVRRRLAVEHFALFVGSRQAAVSPYESVHRQQQAGQPVMIMVTGAARDAEAAYQRFGLATIRNEPADHIATMLEFIAMLLGLDRPDADAEALSFARRHFDGWLMRFTEQLNAATQEDFYLAVCGVLPGAIRALRSQA